MHLLIPTHNRPRRLSRLLASIVRAEQPQGEWTVHLIENGSRVTSEVANTFQGQLPLRFYQLEDGNKSRALNHVLDQLSGNAPLVFFDDDVVLDPNVLTRYAAAFARYPGRVVFGGGLRAEYETAPVPDLRPYLPRSARDYDLAAGLDYRELSGQPVFLGANWGCCAADLRAVGNFDPDFGPGARSGARGQETDAQLRLYAAGCRPVALGNCVVDHWVPEKFTRPEWALQRIHHSSIHLGKSRPGIIKTLGITAKLVYSLVQVTLGNTGIGPRYRIAKASGFFRGLAGLDG